MCFEADVARSPGPLGGSAGLAASRLARATSIFANHGVSHLFHLASGSQATSLCRTSQNRWQVGLEWQAVVSAVTTDVG